MTNPTSFLIHYALFEFVEKALLFIWIGLSTFLVTGVLAIIKRPFSF